jgi:hypothetical protein
MTTEPIPGSVMLTNDNVERIVEVAAKRGFTLQSLRNTIKYNTRNGDETILFTSVYPWSQQISNFNAVPYDPSIHPALDVPLMNTEEFLKLLESTPEIP